MGVLAFATYLAALLRAVHSQRPEVEEDNRDQLKLEVYIFLANIAGIAVFLTLHSVLSHHKDQLVNT